MSELALDRRTLVCAGIVIAMVFVVAGVGLGPVRALFGRLDADIATHERLLAHNLWVLSPTSKDVAAREYAQYGEAVRKKGSTAEENAAMLSEVETLAKRAGITLGSSTPQKARVEADYEVYGVQVEFEAAMGQLVSLFHAIESSPRMLRVDAFSIDGKGGGAPGTRKVSATVSRVVTL